MNKSINLLPITNHEAAAAHVVIASVVEGLGKDPRSEVLSFLWKSILPDLESFLDKLKSILEAEKKGGNATKE